MTNNAAPREMIKYLKEYYAEASAGLKFLTEVYSGALETLIESNKLTDLPISCKFSDEGKAKIRLIVPVSKNLELISEAEFIQTAGIEHKGERHYGVEVRGRGRINHKRKPYVLKWTRPIYERDLASTRIYTDPIDYGMGRIVAEVPEEMKFPSGISKKDYKDAQGRAVLLKKVNLPLVNYLGKASIESRLTPTGKTIIYTIIPASFKKAKK